LLEPNWPARLTQPVPCLALAGGDREACALRANNGRGIVTTPDASDGVPEPVAGASRVVLNESCEVSTVLLDFARGTVLQTIQANRSEHERALVEMVDEWRADIIEAGVAEIERLRAIVDAARAGTLTLEDVGRFELDVRQPSSHMQDYDVAMGMLELASTDVVSLKEDDFARYMLDQWTWREDWDDQIAETRRKQRRRRRR
jgi:hypothetical protein